MEIDAGREAIAIANRAMQAIQEPTLDDLHALSIQWEQDNPGVLSPASPPEDAGTPGSSGEPAPLPEAQVATGNPEAKGTPRPWDPT